MTNNAQYETLQGCGCTECRRIMSNPTNELTSHLWREIWWSVFQPEVGQ